MIPLPILLIHGFNGAPSNWTGPDDRFPDYLAAHGFDPALIRVFSFGYVQYNGKPTYNNLGDMRRIAHRLDDADGDDAHNCSLQRLSADSIARGGPEQVTIIAHSSGGLIARYYLTRQDPDEFGTRYRGNVARAIFLGTPHHGVDIEDILDPLPTNILVYRLMVRLHYLFPPGYREQGESLRAQFRDLRRVTRTTFLGREDAAETPAFKQMHPNSQFLQDINRPRAMPRDAAYFNIVGDIRARVRVNAVGRTLLNGEKCFGDFLVSTGSAGSIPNAPSECYPIVDEFRLNVDIGKRISQLVRFGDSNAEPIPIHRHLRNLPASRKKMLELLQHASQ